MFVSLRIVSLFGVYVVLMGYQTMTQNVAVDGALPCSSDEISYVVWAWGYVVSR